MSHTNHRRGGDKPRKDSERYAFSPMSGTWFQKSEIADGLRGGAGWGGDNSNGHRGYAKAKRGGKKYVRTRVRFHENAATQREANNVECD